MTAELLTLEPLLDAVVAGVEAAGWELSGLQKTSSTEFRGEWEGHTTRSAYLFFHSERWASASIEGYLDETDQGLRATLSLVADVRPAWEHASVPDALERIGRLATAHLPKGYRTPVVLRLRLAEADDPATEAELEARVKLRMPGAAITAGTSSVTALAESTVRAFERVLSDPDAEEVLDGLP